MAIEFMIPALELHNLITEVENELKREHSEPEPIVNQRVDPVIQPVYNEDELDPDAAKALQELGINFNS